MPASSRNLSALSGSASRTDDTAKDTAQNLTAKLTTHGACSLLGHRFHHSLATARAPQPVVQHVAVILFCRCRARRRGRFVAAAREDFVGGLAVHGLVVLPADRTSRDHRGALLRGDRSHPAARRRN